MNVGIYLDQKLSIITINIFQILLKFFIAPYNEPTTHVRTTAATSICFSRLSCISVLQHSPEIDSLFLLWLFLLT